MRALVLGCGQMGRVAIEDFLIQRSFGELTIGCRDVERARSFLRETRNEACMDWTIRVVDVRDVDAVTSLARGHDVICNLTGPAYLNAVPVARAALEAGVPLVDVTDDWEPTLELLDLRDDAAEAGVTVVIGMGASPGVTNVMARRAWDRLDRTLEVRTMWVMRGSDLGGDALARHLLYTLPHRAFVYDEGEMREVRPFHDGREKVAFPVLGPVEVTHIGHPEPFTLGRHLSGVTYADDRAAFLPSDVADLIVALGPAARLEGTATVDGTETTPMDFAVAFLRQRCTAMTDVPTIAALKAEVTGLLNGEPTRISYSAAGRIGIGTGVPAAIVARMLAVGEIHRPGVWPPEAAVDPQSFFDEVLVRDVATVEEETIRL